MLLKYLTASICNGLADLGGYTFLFFQNLLLPNVYLLSGIFLLYSEDFNMNSYSVWIHFSSFVPLKVIIQH